MPQLIDVNELWKCETCFYKQGVCRAGWCDTGEAYRPAYSKLNIIEVTEDQLRALKEKTDGNLAEQQKSLER